MLERDVIAPSGLVTIALCARNARCNSSIGAGRKITTVLGLAREAESAGRRFIISTTTWIWPPCDAPTVVAESETDMLSLVAGMLRHSQGVAAQHSINREGKSNGLRTIETFSLEDPGYDPSWKS